MGEMELRFVEQLLYTNTLIRYTQQVHLVGTQYTLITPSRQPQQNTISIFRLMVTQYFYLSCHERENSSICINFCNIPSRTAHPISICLPCILPVHLPDLFTPVATCHVSNMSGKFCLFLFVSSSSLSFLSPVVASAPLPVFVQLTPPQYRIFTSMSIRQTPFPTSQTK